MIFLLNLRVVVLFLLMTPRYMQPVLTPNAVVQESQPIWMLLQNGQTVGACSSAPGKVSTCRVAHREGNGTPAHREGNRTVGNFEARGVPIPQVKHHRHLRVVMNNKLTSKTCTELVHV